MSTGTIESRLAELAELRHRLGVEGPSEGLAASVRESLGSLPADTPEVCRAFGAAVLRSVESARHERFHRPVLEAEPGDLPDPEEEALAIGPDGLLGEEAERGAGAAMAVARGSSALSQAYDREVQAIASLGIRLPLRAEAAEVPGHVAPLPETHGLVHGGIVQAGGFRLVVKAYRFSEYRREASFRYRQIEVVAGVCDCFDEGGKLLETWSTAERLQAWYASTSVALPSPPCVFNAGSFHGFYRPADWLRQVLANGVKGPAALREDTGLPDPLLYTGKVLRNGRSSTYAYSGFREGPPPSEAIENPLFTAAEQGSSGFVIDTPYVSVFSPGPGSSSVIVTLPRAFRDSVIGKGGKIARLQRKATWEVRLFSA